MIKTASQYHHHSSYERNRIGGHYLDWHNQPAVYKTYPGIDPVPLPADTPPVKEELLSILNKTKIDDTVLSLSMEEISWILRLTYTLTAKAVYSGEDFYYRSAASAGALYPTEIYTAVGGVTGLDDGLYYFDIGRHALFPLRIDNLSEYIAGLIVPPSGNVPIVTFFFTAIFFRSAWKYRDRSYRYHLLDTGHVIENLSLAMKALGIPFHLFYDFDDARINHLLGLDPRKEVSLALAHVPGSESVSRSKEKEIHALPDPHKNASTVSGKEIDYPVIEDIHMASEAVVSRRENHGNEMMESLGVSVRSREEWSGLFPVTGYIDYPECLFRRRSSRNFINEPLDKEDLFVLMEAVCSGERNEPEREPMHDGSLCVGFLANHIHNMIPGLYMLDARQKSFGIVRKGVFADIMSRICLDQEWLRNASIHFLFLSNLDYLERSWGARGYRYAMLTAGRLGQRIYVAATSMRLGCCGIGAFYDGEASEWIGLHQDARLLYLVAVGKVKGLPPFTPRF